MNNELKLFKQKRLTPKEPEHLRYIKSRLAEMKADVQTAQDMADYEMFSKFYGVDVDVKIVESGTMSVQVEPVSVPVEPEEPAVPVETPAAPVAKKRGRPCKA